MAERPRFAKAIERDRSERMPRGKELEETERERSEPSLQLDSPTRVLKLPRLVDFYGIPLLAQRVSVAKASVPLRTVATFAVNLLF